MSRGDRREDIFLDDVDRFDFLDRFGEVQGEHHTAEIRLESAQAQAGRMIAEELAVLGWTESELSSRRKNDPAKQPLAARLRRETTWTTKQIATRLSLGTPKSATTALHRWMRNNPQALMESEALRRETGK